MQRHGANRVDARHLRSSLDDRDGASLAVEAGLSLADIMDATCVSDRVAESIFGSPIAADSCGHDKLQQSAHPGRRALDTSGSELMNKMSRASRWTTVVALAANVAACGGDGGSMPPPPAPAPAPALAFASPAWTDTPPLLAETTRVLAATAMAYDATHAQLIVTVADPAGATLQALDPVTLATRWTLAAPATATRISVSDDGSTAYLALPDLGAVWQVDLANQVAVRSIQVGDRTQGEGPISISVRPGHAGTVAVAVSRVDQPQGFLRAVVYDDGIMRTKTTGANGGYAVSDALSELAFTDADHVVGLDAQSTGCALNRLTLQADGLQPALRAAPFPWYRTCDDDVLVAGSGHLVTGHGDEIDPTTLARVRTWPNGTQDGANVHQRGGGFLDAATGTWVHVVAGGFTGPDSSATSRVAVEEFESTRFTLRRSAVSPAMDPALRDPESRYRMATSGSHVAFTVRDPDTGIVTIHAADLATVPALGHATFAATAASGTGVSGVALTIPAVAMAADKAGHRLVLLLDAGIGPDGNALAVVNPDTGAVETMIPLADEPRDVKVSQTGSIAYVSHLGAIPSLDRVDLATGNVTSVAVRADAFFIKDDDPDAVAVLDWYTNYGTPTLTAVHGMVADTPIDLRATTGSGDASYLASNGADQLVAYGGIDSGIARFAWTGGHLIYGGSSSLATGQGALEPGFGKVWSATAVTDITTGVSTAFPSTDVNGKVAPTSATSAILATEVTTVDTLSWLQPPATGTGAWVSAFSVPLTDSGLPTLHYSPPEYPAPSAIDALDANQVAMRISWFGEPRSSSQPRRIYIVKRTP